MSERRVPADRRRYPLRYNETCCFSELQVLKSEGGYYIGRTCWDESLGFEEPGSRDSEYFTTKELADAALARGFSVRSYAIENEELNMRLSPADPAPER